MHSNIVDKNIVIKDYDELSSADQTLNIIKSRVYKLCTINETTKVQHKMELLKLSKLYLIKVLTHADLEKILVLVASYDWNIRHSLRRTGEAME